MSVEVVALGGGILFMLVAIVGGGFVIREIAMPRVPHWARAASGIVGLLLLLPFALALLRGEGAAAGDATPPSNSGPERQSPERVGAGIEIDSEPATSGDDVRLMGLTVSVRNNPPRVGDTIVVSYSLTNVGKADIQMGFTFVGARNQADERRDSEEVNQDRMLRPGETVLAEGRVLLDNAGPWTLWPCYTLPGDRYCPDRWKAFRVTVE